MHRVHLVVALEVINNECAPCVPHQFLVREHLGVDRGVKYLVGRPDLDDPLLASLRDLRGEPFLRNNRGQDCVYAERDAIIELVNLFG